MPSCFEQPRGGNQGAGECGVGGVVEEVTGAGGAVMRCEDRVSLCWDDMACVSWILLE